MPLPDDQFKAQARKAGRTVSWRIRAGMAGFFAVFIGFTGLLLLSSVLWFGIIALLTAFAIAGYAIRRASVGRHRDLICPNCGLSGEIVEAGDRSWCSLCFAALTTWREHLGFAGGFSREGR
jgi:hypothetical protein